MPGLGQAQRVLRRCLVSLSVASLAVPVLAHAQPAEEAVRIQYTAPLACPDAASFAAQLRERTARGRFAELGELARTFDVELVADAQGFAGNVEFLDDSGAKVSRHVHGEQCEAVVESLALITALALDAALQSEAAEPAPSPPEPPAAPPAPPLAPAQQTSLPPRVTQRWLRGARIGALAGYGSASSAPRVGLLGQLDFRSGSALRLLAHYAWHELTVDAGRSASLHRMGVETSLCPWRLRRGTLSVSPCAAIDFGSLRAGGVPSEQLTSTSAEAIWWASVGAQLGLSWEPDGPFWFELRAAAEFPLRAGYQFTFENPHVIAYQVPYFSGWGGLAAGVRF